MKTSLTSNCTYPSRQQSYHNACLHEGGSSHSTDLNCALNLTAKYKCRYTCINQSSALFLALPKGILVSDGDVLVREIDVGSTLICWTLY